MTDPYPGIDGRAYEAQVYGKAAAQPDGYGVAAGATPDADETAGDYSRAQAEQLQQGQQFRPGLPTSHRDYRSVPHEELQRYVNDGVDAAQVNEQGAIANDYGNTLNTVAQGFRSAVAKDGMEWSGDGAEATHAFFGGLAKWSEDAGNSAYLSSNRLSQQSAALTHAKNTMPPPAGRSVTESQDLAMQRLADGDWNGAMDTLGGAEEQARMRQQAHEQAAGVLAARDGTLYDTGSTQPVFTRPPRLGEAPTSGSEIASQPVDTSTGVSSFAPLGGPPAPAPTGTGSTVPPTGAPVGNAPPTTSTPAPGGSTGAAPPAGQRPGYLPPTGQPSVPGYSRPSTGIGGAALGSTGAGLGKLGSETERTSGNRQGGGRAGGRNVGGAGKPPAGKPPATGGGAKGADTPERAPGARSGTAQPKDPANITRGGPAAAEAAKSSGVRGAGGVPPGGGRKEEDKERQRPDYLVDDNPEETYDVKPAEGPDGEKIVNPVIGEK